MLGELGIVSKLHRGIFSTFILCLLLVGSVAGELVVNSAPLGSNAEFVVPQTMFLCQLESAKIPVSISNPEGNSLVGELHINGLSYAKFEDSTVAIASGDRFITHLRVDVPKDAQGTHSIELVLELANGRKIREHIDLVFDTCQNLKFELITSPPLVYDCGKATAFVRVTNVGPFVEQYDVYGVFDQIQGNIQKLTLQPSQSEEIPVVMDAPCEASGKEIEGRVVAHAVSNGLISELYFNTDLVEGTNPKISVQRIPSLSSCAKQNAFNLTLQHRGSDDREFLLKAEPIGGVQATLSQEKLYLQGSSYETILLYADAPEAGGNYSILFSITSTENDKNTLQSMKHIPVYFHGFDDCFGINIDSSIKVEVGDHETVLPLYHSGIQPMNYTVIFKGPDFVHADNESVYMTPGKVVNLPISIDGLPEVGEYSASLLLVPEGEQSYLSGRVQITVVPISKFEPVTQLIEHQWVLLLLLLILLICIITIVVKIVRLVFGLSSITIKQQDEKTLDMINLVLFLAVAGLLVILFVWLPFPHVETGVEYGQVDNHLHYKIPAYTPYSMNLSSMFIGEAMDQAKFTTNDVPNIGVEIKNQTLMLLPEQGFAGNRTLRITGENPSGKATSPPIQIEVVGKGPVSWKKLSAVLPHLTIVLLIMLFILLLTYVHVLVKFGKHENKSSGKGNMS